MTKRPRRSDEEDEDGHGTASSAALGMPESRSTRRKTMDTSVTPAKRMRVEEDVDVNSVIRVEHASVKKQYGRSARNLREQVANRGRAKSEDKEQEEEEEGKKDTRRTNAQAATPSKHVGRRGRPSVASAKSGAEEEEQTQKEQIEEISLPRNPAGRTPVLTIPALSSTSASTGRKSRRGTWYYEPVETDEEKETPLPTKRSSALRKSEASADAGSNSRKGQNSSQGIDVFERSSSRNDQETPRKAMDDMRRRTRSLASSAPPSDDEEETKSPTKNVKSVRRQPSTFTTPKRSSRLSSAASSSEASSPEEDNSQAIRRPTRPRKGRQSYNAKVRRAPSLDLRSETSSVVASEDAVAKHMYRNVPDTDTEYSSTEANLTPASVKAFTRSSPPVMDQGSDEEMEVDEDRKIVLDESILPLQSASPSKHPLAKTLPENFHRFVQPQKMAVLQKLHTPAYIEVAPVANGDRAIVEAPPLQQLEELLKGTCERGEGNSCLLLGPRGSGKTLLLNTALNACTNNPIVVRLSGYTQTTDRLAMQEIAYQLNHQTDSVFSIPEEDREEGEAPENDEIDFTPPAAYLPTLVSQLTTLKRPVVVVLDAFDLFISHPRQALLYCLLDTAQACRAGEGRNGLLIIGLSCVVNCLNNLEKRVKSRFSHRILKVCNPSTLAEYLEIAKTLLSVSLTHESVECTAKDLAKWNLHWRKCVEEFVGSSTTKRAFVERYAFRRDIGHLCRLLTSVVQELSTDSPWLSNSRLLFTSESSGLPEQFSFMNRLPDAAMWVLVSLIHWDTAGHATVNLRMVLDACNKAAMYQDSIRFVVSNTGEARSVTTTAVAPALLQAAYEDLISTRVLQPSASSANQRFEFVKYKPMIDRETLKRVVEKNGNTAVKNWLKNASVLNG